MGNAHRTSRYGLAQQDRRSRVDSRNTANRYANSSGAVPSKAHIATRSAQPRIEKTGFTDRSVRGEAAERIRGCSMLKTRRARNQPESAPIEGPKFARAAKEEIPTSPFIRKGQGSARSVGQMGSTRRLRPKCLPGLHERFPCCKTRSQSCRKQPFRSASAGNGYVAHSNCGNLSVNRELPKKVVLPIRPTRQDVSIPYLSIPWPVRPNVAANARPPPIVVP